MLTWLKFRLERWLQRGTASQLALMAALIVLISVVGGILAALGTDKFEDVGTAIWWAFLRLTDPGYLGDDEGFFLRVISTVVTVLGYVIFMGSLIAILTQWLARTMRQLEAGLTPISMRGHVVILGWTNRTPEIVLKLLAGGGRLRRFLDRRSVSKLRIVILADHVTAETRLELRAYLGDYWNEGQIFLRSGSSLRPEDLLRLDLQRASVVVVPGADFALGGAELTDTRIVKTLLTLEALFGTMTGERPQVVAEIFDPQKAPVARNTMTTGLEIVASDQVISCLILQSVRHRRLFAAYFEILSHKQGNSLYLRDFPEFVGVRPCDLAAQFPTAVVLGIVRDNGGTLKSLLNPSADVTIEAGDLLILLARTFLECEPTSRSRPSPTEGRPPPAPALETTVARHRILLLGWSYKMAALLTELSACRTKRFEVVVGSRVPVADRETWLSRVRFDRERVEVSQVFVDYGVLGELAATEPHTFDQILFLGSGWLDSPENADARTILGHVLLGTLLRGREDAPPVMVELLDPDNAQLISGGLGDILISPRLLSHILAHVSLRPELNCVFENLFRSGGVEITARDPAAYGLEGTVDFARIQQATATHGEIALGVFQDYEVVRSRQGKLELNPPRERHWTLSSHDRVVVLAEHE